MDRRVLLVGAIVGIFAVLSVWLWLGITVQDKNAISLSVTMSSTSAPQAQPIHVSITVRNDLDLSNDPPVSYAWPVENMSWGMCANGPIAIAVYRGNVGTDNASSGRWQNVFVDFHLGGPIIFAPGTDSIYCPLRHFRFLPFATISRALDLQGEYGLSETSSGALTSFLYPFCPGVYTLVVGDLWGHVITEHFSILAGTTG